MLRRRADAGVGGDGDAEAFVGGSHRNERDGHVGRHPGHDDVVDAHVAQDRQRLGAVHRRHALVPGQHQVLGADADFGHHLDGRVGLVPRPRRRRRPDQRGAGTERSPADQGSIGQMDDQDAPRRTPEASRPMVARTGRAASARAGSTE